MAFLQFKRKLNFSAFCLIALFIVFVFIAQIPMIHELLAWDRAEIQSGQWWRVFTGNITHTNYFHLLMNVSSLLLLALMHHAYYKTFSIVFMVCVMMIVIGVVMFFTSFDWYVGLSGVLYGLFVWGAVKDIQNKRSLGWLMLFGALLKLLFDTFNQEEGLVANLIEASVAYQAHWAGALVGLVFAVCIKKRS